MIHNSAEKCLIYSVLDTSNYVDVSIPVRSWNVREHRKFRLVPLILKSTVLQLRFIRRRLGLQHRKFSKNVYELSRIQTQTKSAVINPGESSTNIAEYLTEFADFKELALN